MLGRALSEADAHWTGGDRETFVADLDQAVLGTCWPCANWSDGGARVANGGVMTDAARGIPRVMRRHALARGRERGVSTTQFNSVVNTNVMSVRLWQSLGFSGPSGTRSWAVSTPW
ncbi:N-acetyltransferase family protein [Methylobacterium sp. NEAU K]|uniref:GNAT family N-acetyltransferase n=1 Tax=Methylobacterium sp. NEAU K TaxID=3064946 RepID=UPI00351F44D0